MVYDQISIYDIDPDVDPQPEMWDCRKTCARFGEKVDYPEWWNGEARCLYGFDKVDQVVHDNVTHFYCRFYERRRNK